MSTSRNLEQLSAPMRALALTGVVRAFPKRTRFIVEGDVGNSIYAILAGRVKVFASDMDGKEFVFGTMAAAPSWARWRWTASRAAPRSKP